MRVSRHGSIAGLLRTIHEHAAKLSQLVAQLINRSSKIEPQVCRDLLITAASAVQLVSHFADQRDKLRLDEVMYILRLIILKKGRRCRRLLANLLQSLQNVDELVT